MSGLTDSGFGTLVAVNVGPKASPLPLTHTAVVGNISGPIGSVSVTQTFENPFTERIELSYLFPLPHEAAITDFEIRIGTRTIQAEMKELEAARTAFRDAINAGQAAGLLEQRRPNLFSMQIGNVAPGEQIITILRYQERIRYADDRYEFVFPMGVTPKFHADPSQAAQVDSPVADPGAKIGDVSLTLTLDTGVPVGDPISPSHTIQIDRQDEHHLTVSLPADVIPNKDFVLRYPVAAESVQTAVWLSGDADADTALITVLPSRLDTTQAPDPREFIFVIDRSGSMQGEPITQAKNALRACLRALGSQDTFLLQAFDNAVEWFNGAPSSSPAPDPESAPPSSPFGSSLFARSALPTPPAAQPITQDAVNAADHWLNTIDARGGTNILDAITAALAVSPDATRQRYVVFLTDGAVSADDQALERIKQQRGTARIFTFGIGPSVNRSLLVKMAELGRGTSQFLQLKENIEDAVTKFQDRISYPALQDLTLTWQGAQVWDSYPAVLPDLYAGQPLELVTRLKREPDALAATLTVSGKRKGQIETFSVTLPTVNPSNPTLRRVWARTRVDDLWQKSGGDDKIRQQIIGLAIEHRLLTPFTAFVAIDSEVIATPGEKAHEVSVSVPLPEGLDRAGFFGGQPQGASPLFLASAPRSASAPGSASGSSSSRLMKMRSYSAPPDDLSDLFAGSAAPESTPSEPSEQLRRQSPFLGQRMFQASPPEITSIEERIKALTRTQNVSGSWDDDVELTAAALLAFVRAGHTTRIGHYRQQVKKAALWLQVAFVSGFAAVVRWRALLELEQAESTPNGQYATMAVGAATTDPERAALFDDTVKVPSKITSLDDLRIAALIEGGVKQTPLFANPADRRIAQFWLAVGKI